MILSKLKIHDLNERELMFSSPAVFDFIWPYNDYLFTTRRGDRPSMQLFYYANGSDQFFMPDGTHFTVKPGDVLFASGTCMYQTKALGDDPRTGILISIRNIVDQDLCPILIIGSPVVLASDTAHRYEHAFREMLETYENHRHEKLLLASRFAGLLHDLLSEYHAENSLDTVSELQPAISYIESHLSTCDSVPELARLCQMSESRFRRAFKRGVGMSPTQYLMSLRLDRARDMLTSGQFSVKQVAESLGFYDTAHFSRMMMKHRNIQAGKLSKLPK